MDNNQSMSRIDFSECSESIENHQEQNSNTNFQKIKNIQIPNLIVSDSASSSCGSSAKNVNANFSLAPNFVRDKRIKSSSVHDLRQHSVNYNLLNVECVGVSFFCPTLLIS